jgi:hypothetical protein
MQKVPRPSPKPKRWNFTPPNGWRHERVTTHRPAPSTNWSWKPPKKPRKSRAELERNRKRDLARLEAAWCSLTGEVRT